MAKRPKQLGLFDGVYSELGPSEIHALGLLGWRDPIWTQRIKIPLCGGQSLFLRLIDIRALHEVARKPDPDPPDTAANAAAKPIT